GASCERPQGLHRPLAKGSRVGRRPRLRRARGLVLPRPRITWRCVVAEWDAGGGRESIPRRFEEQSAQRPVAPGSVREPQSAEKGDGCHLGAPGIRARLAEGGAVATGGFLIKSRSPERALGVGPALRNSFSRRLVPRSGFRPEPIFDKRLRLDLAATGSHPQS